MRRFRPSFRRLILFVASLRPSPGTATRVANEEKREVLLPWGRSFATLRMTFLTVSRSLVRHRIAHLYQRQHVPIGTCPLWKESLPAGSHFFIPMAGSQGLSKMEDAGKCRPLGGDIDDCCQDHHRVTFGEMSSRADQLCRIEEAKARSLEIRPVILSDSEESPSPASQILRYRSE